MSDSVEDISTVARQVADLERELSRIQTQLASRRVLLDNLVRNEERRRVQFPPPERGTPLLPAGGPTT